MFYLNNELIINTFTNKERKRTKLTCLRCGSEFDDEYNRKHELTQYGGEKALVKHLGTFENLFIDASKKKMYYKNEHTTGNIK